MDCDAEGRADAVLREDILEPALTEMDDVDTFFLVIPRSASEVELARWGGRGAGREGSNAFSTATRGAALGVLLFWSVRALRELGLRLGLFLGRISADMGDTGP